MKEQIKRLRDLQALDLERDKLHDNVEKKRVKLREESALLDTLSADLDVQKAALGESRMLHATKVAERNKAEHDHNDAKSKFRSVTNSREYAAAERELENFKKVIAQLDEEVGQLASAIADAEASILEKEGKVGSLRDELQSEQRVVDDEAAIAEQRSREIEDRCKALAVHVDRQALQRYKFIRSKRSGEAVVPTIDGACSGCHMRLPPQLYIQLQRGKSLELCQSCQRILYYPEPQENPAPAPDHE